MKAVVFHAPGDVRVESVPVPVCGEDELLVSVDACAVCGSDLKAALSGNTRIKPPRVMGHEFTGIIVKKGRDAVGGFATGTRVVMATSISCGGCYYCQRGLGNLCVELAPMGFSYHGGMAEFVRIPARALANGHLVATPAEIPAELAALAEPVSCAVNSVARCAVTTGDTVLVIGHGPLGIMNACVARAAGAAKVIIAGRNKNRLRQCSQFPFDRIVNPAEEDLKRIVMEETNHLGADVVIVAAPDAAPQEQALELARKRGRIMLFASLPVGKNILHLDSRLIHYNELQVLGASDSTPTHVKTAIEILASGKFPFDKLITHQLPLDEIHRAFDLMRSGEALRVVLHP
ncbi:MAG: alcohol dehydrogenase catalytic domain-containing protein [Puniceicoccales bacterium]|jgi:L-iditol 2-dehydrogenase|nr:alcohol dehydrogenase catalytic domain-containing protein [Puniceicoccales bacterium]